MEKKLEYVFSSIPKEDILAIYLGGSRNNNLHREDSDYDLVVVKKTSVNSLLGKIPTPKHKTGKIADYRTYDLVYFINRVIVENIFNDLELIYRKPLYLDESFKNISEILYKNRDKIINKKLLLRSIVGNLFQIYNKVYNTSGKVNIENIKFNKEIANYFRYITQFYKVIEENKFYVIFEGEFRNKFLKYKNELPELINLELIKDLNIVEENKKIKEIYENLEETENPFKEEIQKEIVRNILEIS